MLFYCKNFLQIFLIITTSSVLTIHADDTQISIVDSYEEIQQIREKFTNLLKIYIDDRIKEINTKLNGTSNRWDFIRDMNNINTWWSIDMNKRQEMILGKLPKILYDSKNDEDFYKAFEQLKDEFTKNLAWAETFWHNETDKVLAPMRENPERFHGLIREPIFTTEHPYLNLPPQYQPLYNSQMRNLTHIASLTKEIIRSSIANLVPTKLPPKDDISYISLMTKYEMISDNLIKGQNLYIDSARIMSTERVSGDWRIQHKYGPTQEEFDREYISLSKYSTNMIKDFCKTVEITFKEFI